MLFLRGVEPAFDRGCRPYKPLELLIGPHEGKGYLTLHADRWSKCLPFCEHTAERPVHHGPASARLQKPRWNHLLPGKDAACNRQGPFSVPTLQTTDLCSDARPDFV